MDLTKEERQRKEFRDILFELATRQELLQERHTRYAMYKRLEDLYYAENENERFRHFYSDIFTVLTQIQQDSSLGDINILGQNLSLLRAGYMPQNYDKHGKMIDVSDNIKKLYDHVSLDIARILYSEAGDRKTSGEAAIIDIQTQINQIDADAKKTIEHQNDFERKLGKQQKEYIAILGIFAAVVLAFTGSVTFSSSVLENINAVSSYRIVLIALIIGLVFVNILFGLFYYVDRLVNGKNSGEIKPLLISNIVIVLLIACTVCAWFHGVVEGRNIKFHQEASTYTSYESRTSHVG